MIGMISRSPSFVVPALTGAGAIFDAPSRYPFSLLWSVLSNRMLLDLPSRPRLGWSDARSACLHTRMAESILHRVAAGDQGAMRECIDRFGGLVWALAKRTTPNEAEDAVQDIFLDLWKSSQRYSESLGSETTFVAMIARRRLIDRVRKNVSRTKLESQTTLNQPESVMPAAHPATSLDAAKAVQAFASLPTDQQRVLRLAVERSLSHEQIALSTGLPLGTVKTHVRRGLIHIRSMLGAVTTTSTRVPSIALAADGRAVS